MVNQLSSTIISALVQSLSNGVVMFDLQKQVLLANPAATRFTGLPTEGYNLSELFVLFTSVSLEKMVDEALSLEKTSHVKEASVAQFIYDIFVVPVKDELNKVVGGAIIFHDITDIKNASASLMESNERFEFVTKATNDAVYDWNILTNSVWFNGGMHTLFGYSQDKVEQTLEWFQEHIHPDDRQKLDIELEQIIKTAKQSSKLEYRFRRADGTYADVQDRGFLSKDSKGKPIRFIGVLEDISKVKELERMKDEFVSVASHELRTPLTAIDGLVSMILDGEYGPVGENLKQPLEDVTTSSERLINLVNDLLSLSRINAGRMKYTLSDFSIGEVVTETIQLLQPVVKNRDIKLAASDIEEVSVQGDVDKIKQVLNNLIGNSLKFTDKGSITVSVKTVGDLVEVRVVDTGIGIAKDDQSKLFGQFQQLDSGKGRPIGTGLGLHISKDVIRKMGGELWIDSSEKGVGSTFAFSIPKSQSPLAQKVKQEIDGEAEANPNQKSDTATSVKV